MRKLAFLAVLAVALCAPSRALALNALIVHDGSAISPGPDIRTQLAARLVAKGYTVTQNSGVPAGSLATYQQIWDLRYSSAGAAPGNPFTTAEVTQYLEYLSGGGSLFLMGENGISFGTRNQAIANFILAAGGGSVTLASTTGNAQTVQAPFTGPTAVASVTYASVGGVTSLPKGQFITKDTASSGAAISLGPGTMSNAALGTLIAVFDVNFLQSTAADPLKSLVDNLIVYLGSPTPATYTVTYNGNGNTGGTVPVDGATYAAGATVTVKANTGALVRTGYTFNGWNTAANGSGTSYAASGSATFAMGAANVTLYAQWTAAPTYTVTYSGNGSTGGTVPVDSGSYTAGGTVTVKANTGTLVRTGYAFNGWNTAANGTGTSYAASGSATFTIGAANVTLYAQWSLVSFTGESPGGTGSISASFTGGDTGCGYTAQQFIPLTGNAASPPSGSAPASVSFPQGLFNFTVGGCTTPGGVLTFTISYPQALPFGTQYWKYGRTSDNNAPHWYVLPATITGSSVTFSITDGGLGDDDLTANGTILDPGGPGTPAAVPTMGEWARIILALLLAAVGVFALRRRADGRLAPT